MARFQAGNIIIRAEQFGPAGVIIEGVEFHKAQTIDAQRTRGIIYDRPERWVFNSPHGPIDLTPGDWIVTMPSGRKLWCDDSIFRELFQPKQSIFKRRRK